MGRTGPGPPPPPNTLFFFFFSSVPLSFQPPASSVTPPALHQDSVHQPNSPSWTPIPGTGREAMRKTVLLGIQQLMMIMMMLMMMIMFKT